MSIKSAIKPELAKICAAPERRNFFQVTTAGHEASFGIVRNIERGER